MKTESELNADILKITITIQNDFPELLKYMGEMPVTIPDNNGSGISIKALNDYYNSLDTLLKDYATNHSDMKK